MGANEQTPHRDQLPSRHPPRRPSPSKALATVDAGRDLGDAGKPVHRVRLLVLDPRKCPDRRRRAGGNVRSPCTVPVFMDAWDGDSRLGAASCTHHAGPAGF